MSWVAATNLAYADSDVDQTINLVAVEEVVGYTRVDNRTDLHRLRNKADGYMDEVHSIRDRVRADAVILLNGGVGGTAFTMADESTEHEAHAFGVSSAHAGFFMHELGHIMGLRHDRYAHCKHDPDDYDPVVPECPPTVTPYAYGYVNQELFEPRGSTTVDPDAPETARWRTIMAYLNQCSDAGVPGACQPALLRFSNPNQRYPDADGDPMGKSGTQNTDDVDGPADAARTLNGTRDTVANFREGRAVKVSFAAATYAVTEGGSVAVTVQLDAAPGRTLDLPIPLTATSTTGAWPGDYTFPTSITFGRNQTSRTVTFRASQDTRQEATETVTLGFGTPLPAGVTVDTAATAHATATVTVTDNDPATTDAPSVSTMAIISDPETAYAAGEEITVAVVFTKPISVTGTPQIELTVGTNTRQALCQDAASEVLTCTYTVAADESDTDGVSIAANSLALNGGTIQDMESPPQAATGSDLDHNAVAGGHAVDGDTPDLASATVDGATVTLTYDEALDATAVPWANAFTVTAGSDTVLIASVQVAERVVTLTLVSEVVHTDSVTLAYSPPAGSPALQDAAGNPAANLTSRTLTNNTPGPTYDTDDDGLIEITTLAQLDAMRHDPDGNGNPTTAGATAYATAFPNVTRVVCGASSGGCRGYELEADLDFLDTNGDGQVDTNDDTNGDGQVDAADTPYGNSGAGWESIGTDSDRFRTTFEGNGHTIRHLFVNRPATDNVGLVGYMNGSGTIRNVGLIDAEVRGRDAVGGLVGLNSGSITGSYTTGRVEGQRDWVGGLVGTNFGTIHTSYATGRVSGINDVGGLVGWNHGTIHTSYATGRVSGSRNNVGGLVGRVPMGASGQIRTSYATGRVSGNSHVGGLVGHQQGGNTTHSYWNTTTSGQPTSPGGTAQTTEALQTPTGYSGIYADWNVDLNGDGTTDDPWHFGTSSQYPALKGPTGTWTDFGHQLRAGPTSLTVTTDTGLVELSWTAVSTTAWSPAPDVTYTIYRNASATPIAEGLTGPQYTDRTVTRGSRYTYQVAAVVDGGEATRSEPSSEVTAPQPAGSLPVHRGRAAQRG